VKQEEMFSELINLARSELGDDTAAALADSPSSPAVLTSLDRVRLLVAIERRFDIEIEQEDAAELTTLEDLVELINAKSAAKSSTAEREAVREAS
jgi:acyl carrier protein